MKKKKNKNNIGLYAALGCGALALYFLFKKDEASTSSAAAASAAEETAAEARTGADSGNATAAKIADYLLISEEAGVRTEAGNAAQEQAIKLFESCKDQEEFLKLLKDVCIELGINDVVELLTFFNLERTLDLQESFVDFNVSFPEITLADLEEETEQDKADKAEALMIANYLKDEVPNEINRQSALKILESYRNLPDRLLDVITYIVDELKLNGWEGLINRFVTDADKYTFKKILSNNNIELTTEFFSTLKNSTSSTSSTSSNSSTNTTPANSSTSTTSSTSSTSSNSSTNTTPANSSTSTTSSNSSTSSTGVQRDENGRIIIKKNNNDFERILLGLF